MEQQNIILIVIIILISLYCCERIFLLVREKFTDIDKLNNIVYKNNLRKLDKSKEIGNLICNAEYILETIHHDILPIKKADYLKKIIKQLINEINKKTNLHFRFIEFEHVIEQIFKNNSKRFIIDFFIHEIDNYYNRRLILDILDKNNEIFIRKITIGNGKKIDTNLVELDNDNFDKKILNDDNLKFENTIIGLYNTKLEYSNTNLKNSMERNRNFTKWIEPPKIVNKKKTWPCRNEGKWWDTYGVKNNQIPSLNCRGVNTSYTSSLKTSNFKPNHKNIDSNGANNWLFGEYLQVGSSQSILP
tara:strand:- start:385 stop:1293 length:909 start_codon:yes stop_codon:yes gene_type:complete